MSEFNASRILRILLEGERVYVNGKIYAMSDQNELCEVRARGNEIGELYLKVNFGMFTLAEFISWCDNLTEEALFDTFTAKVLGNINKR